MRRNDQSGRALSGQGERCRTCASALSAPGVGRSRRSGPATAAPRSSQCKLTSRDDTLDTQVAFLSLSKAIGYAMGPFRKVAWGTLCPLIRRLQ
jgi:hypothetical protein